MRDVSTTGGYVPFSILKYGDTVYNNKNKRELKKLIDCCKATGYACCDYETNAEPIYNKGFKPTILSVSWMPGFGASIPLDHFETKDYTSPGWNWKRC